MAEMRSCRRVARTWVFIVLAILISAGWYIGLLESINWPRPPTGWDHDAMSPRYTGATMLSTFVAIFSFGIIFLAFDIRARDAQNRIREVIDTLPVSNVEIIFGRVAGIILLLLIPCAFFLTLVGCYEVIATLLDFPFRIGMQTMSVVSFVTWSVIPNLLFFGALVACLSVLVRFRLLVAAIALGVLIGSVWVADQIPVRLQDSFSLYVGSALFPSDLASVFVTPTIAGSRLAFVLISLALLVFAASLLPRTDPRRMMNTLMGVSTAGLATAMFLGLVFSVQSTENVKAQWIEAHGQQSLSAFPDVQRLEGNIELHPGRKIILDVALTILTPPANSTDSVVLSLNPGYRIQNISIDGTDTSDFRFENGILKLPSSLFPAETHEVQVQAVGKPDDRFAYLDQARDFQRLKDSRVSRFGLRSSVFHTDFVALMPDTVWYPISGTVIDRDKIERRPRDLFTTDLTVSAPRNWQVATVGRRQNNETERRARFQFTNHEPVPELALIASNFEQRKTTVEGVEFELLISKKHLHNLEVLSPISDRIKQWLVDRIQTARTHSLEYPYESFYVVEVPSSLRTYGDGWRMESVLQPPGMMLIRETAFPTAPFEAMLNRVADESESENETHESAFNELLNYFANDQQGGNPFASSTRNFFSHQLSATGRGATVLQFLLDQLVTELTTQFEGCSIISESEFGHELPLLTFDKSPGNRTGTSGAFRRIQIASFPSTWQVMDQIPLFDLDFEAYPIPSYRVLLTKGHALAKSIIARYGEEKVGMFLEQLLTNYGSRSFTLEDFHEVGSTVGLDLSEWILPWLEDTVLPGYILTNATVTKLETSDLRTAEYQTSFLVHNAEPMQGLVRLVWSDDQASRFRWRNEGFRYSDPILIDGRRSKRFAIQTTNPLVEIWVESFLARNRGTMEVLLPEFDQDTLQQSVVLPFVTDDDWNPADTKSIIVDDLDSGFSITNLDSNMEDSVFEKQFLSFSAPEVEYEQGLPLITYPEPSEWTREFDSKSHGHYLRTHARIFAGKGMSVARFKASLPNTGSWILEFFVNSSAVDNVSFVSATTIIGYGGVGVNIEHRNANRFAPEEHYRLEVNDGLTEWKEKFDIANAHAGWNEVGKFDLGSTEVAVLLSDWAGHEEVMVYADAIRWTPVDPE